MTRSRCRLQRSTADRRRSAQELYSLGYVDVTVVTFAVHIAYLDPRTGTGYLVTPHPETDVGALDDPLVGAAWSQSLHDRADPQDLSLHEADRRYAFDELSRRGWEPLLDEDGAIEEAGWTTDGRLALCVYGEPPVGEPCVEVLSRSLMALDLVAGLHDPSRECAEEHPPGRHRGG